MHDFLSPQHPIIKFLTLFCNIIILNIVFILTSMPIFTIGPSIAAAYKTIYHIRHEKTPVILATYVKSFQDTFLPALILWCILLFGFVFFGLDLYVVVFLLPQQYTFLQIPIWCMVFVLLSIGIYAFPMLALYKTKGLTLAKNAILLSIANIPVTIFIVVVQLLLCYMALSSLLSLAIMSTLGIMFGFALIMYLNSFFLFRIFEKCDIKNPPVAQS